MSQERFEASLKFVLKWEGSKFTNHPADNGGPTRYGVTQKVYNQFRAQSGRAAQSVEFISMEEVRAIYRRGYWAPVQGDAMPAPVDLVLFDTGVLMGVGRAAKLLQAAVGVAVDGDIGPNTRAAVAARNALTVARDLLNGREARLRAIVAANPSQKVFLKGWLNRLNDLRKTVGILVPEALAEDESVGNDDEDPLDVAGRADAGLADEEGSDADAGELALGPTLLRPSGVAAFLAAARALEGGDGSAVYVLDTLASTSETLIARHPGAEEAFEIPALAVETVTPLGVSGAAVSRILASVAFRPGFESLARTFLRVQGGAGADPPLTGDEDPGAPAAGEAATVADLALSRAFANEGASDDADTEADDAEPLPENFGFPTMPLDINKAKAFLNACINANPRVKYGLGAKVPFFGAVPGQDFKAVDCSGFVREAIRRATQPKVPFPDGSVVQHDWVKSKQFKKSTVGAGTLKDGAVRIAFLRPQDAPSGIGHVVLIHNGVTLESHGGVGPNARPWTGAGWQAKAHVYVLTPPV